MSSAQPTLMHLAIRQPIEHSSPLMVGALDTYAVGPVLGEGRMAIVHEGLNIRTGASVALKVLREPICVKNTTAIPTAGQGPASSPGVHIVRHLDTIEGRLGISAWVNERAPGVDLAVAARMGSLPRRLIQRVGLGLCQLLQDLHQSGRIHSAVDASHVLIAGDGRDQDGRPCVRVTLLDLPRTHIVSQPWSEKARPRSEAQAIDVMGFALLLDELCDVKMRTPNLRALIQGGCQLDWRARPALSDFTEALQALPI